MRGRFVIRAGGLAAAALLATPASSHDSIQNAAVEGVWNRNALLMVHGCADGVTQRPVIAQSVVFPTQAPRITRSDGVPTTMEDEIEGGSLANLFRPIQDRNIFERHETTVDELGNGIGWHKRNGLLRTDSYGEVPFQFASIFFVSPCVKSARIELAIADICKVSANPVDGEVNLFIPNATAAFPDPAIHGVGEPTGFYVENDVPPSEDDGCTDNGDGTYGYDLLISPSDADVDAHLPIPGYWPRGRKSTPR
ncbi:MAG: hypothetical protein U0900_08655 [Myxococcota bacterium]